MVDVITATRTPESDSAKGTGWLAMPVLGRIARRGRGNIPARLTLAAVPTAPGRARHFAARKLRRWQVPSGTVQTAEIIISELVTNAYQATAAGPRRSELRGTRTARCISLRLSRTPGQVLIMVSDHNLDLPAPSDAGADADGGRGLMLVQALSEQWGYRRTPSGGKVVYAVLSIPGKHTEQEGQS